MLPDRTKVWLNTESSIKYPVDFNDNPRRVEVSGEVYFDVAQSISSSGEKRSFVVIVPGKAEIHVMGTQFNINAYNDENVISATLMEGSIKLLSLRTGEIATLKPGEEASLDSNGSMNIGLGNVDEVLAWRSGKFIFDNADMQKITRQISRWHDVEFIHHGKVETHFSGTFTRDNSLQEILRALEEAGSVKFSAKGNIITVDQVEN